MYGNSITKKQKPSTNYLVRPRLGPLRSIFSPKPMAYTADKKRKLKKSTGAKMEYRKKPDYADTAYREAVGRLRILLAESYTPIKRPLRELDSAGEDTDNQSMISRATSRCSKSPGYRPYYHYLTFPKRYTYYPSVRPTSVAAPDIGDTLRSEQHQFQSNAAPPEIMSFLEKQEEYIEQLEKESRFCREELSSLLSKVKDVLSENENLHERQKSNIIKSVFNHLETETETENETDLLHQKTTPSPKKGKKTVLEGPAIVFESRISELEAQLTQARIDLKKALEDNDNYKKKISDGSIIDGMGFDHYKRQIESLQREKDLLQETVTKLQSTLSMVKTKENDTCDQVKRSLETAEQAQYEKNAADMEIRRLKDELERQHAKLREAISEQSRRISDERAAVERRYTQQIEQLTTELGVHWETTNKLQLELDKQRRENADMRRELTQKQALLDGMKKDMQSKIMTLQSDIGVNGAEKSALEQQIATLQMTNERNERQSKQEVVRFQAELQSLRQRLDRADADLIHSRRENIRLNEQIASLEKEIKLNSALNEEQGKQSADLVALPPPKDEKQLSSLIGDMESKHAATVAELEGMIHSQNQLMDKLSVECHTLTQKLEDASARHKVERAKLRTKNAELLSRLGFVWDCLKQSDGEHRQLILMQHREEIQQLQTSLNRLNSRLSQNISSAAKDEDYSSVSNKGGSKSHDDPIESRTLNVNPNETVQETDYRSLHQEQINQNADITNSYGSQDIQSYDQQYGNADLQSYDQTDPNNEHYPSQYQVDPNQQYMTGSDQQYIPHSDQQYITDANQQYITAATDQQYITDMSQDYGMDPNNQQHYDSDLNYAPDPNQTFIDPHHPDQEYVDSNLGQDTEA